MIVFEKKQIKRNKNHSPMITEIVSTLIITISVAIISYETREQCAWVSALMLSISTGIIAGLVLYILSNYRFSQLDSFTRDYEYLRETVKITNSLNHELNSFLHDIETLYEEEINDYLYDCIDGFDGLCSNLYEYPSQLFDELDIIVDSEDGNLIESNDFYVLQDNIQAKEGTDLIDEAKNIAKELLCRTTEINTKVRKVMNYKRIKRDIMRNQPL